MKKNFMELHRKEIIDNLTLYFGEKYRSRISERVNNCVFLTLPRDLLLNYDNILDDVEKYYEMYLKTKVNKEDIFLEKEETLLDLKKSLFEINKILVEFDNKKSLLFKSHCDKYEFYNIKDFIWTRDYFLNFEYSENIDASLIVKFANNLGVNYGSDVSIYLKDTNFRNFLLDNDFWNVYYADRNFHEKISIERTSFYKEANEVVSSLSMVDFLKNEIRNYIIEYMKISPSVACSFNYIDYKDETLKHLIILPLKYMCNENDINHELLHILGSDLLSIKNSENYVLKNGACETSVVGHSISDRDKYEDILNEVIVESTARKISNNNYHLGSNLVFYKEDRNKFFRFMELFEELLNDHKDIFTQTILSSDVDVIENNMGFDNYDKLLNYIDKASKINMKDIDKKEKLKKDIEKLNEDIWKMKKTKVVVNNLSNYKRNDY